MASDLRGGGRPPERRAEALDPSALRDVGSGLGTPPEEEDRPHPGVPPWARADRALVARRDRAERRVGGGVRAARADGGDGLPGIEVPRDVRREQSDRLPRRDVASLLRKGLCGHGAATGSGRNPSGRANERDAGALERLLGARPAKDYLARRP